MKILQLSPQVPFPLDTGGRIGIYGITKYLSERGNIIHFAALSSSADRIQAENELKKFCIPYFLDADTRNKLLPAFFNLFSPVPYNISKYNKRELKIFLRQFFKNNEVDIIHVDNLHLAWCIKLLRELTNAPIVLREHNVELKIMQRFYERQNNFLLRIYSGIQYKKFLKYEPKLTGKFDKCIMVSKEDEKLLKEMNPNVKTAVVGVGIDKKLLENKGKKIIPYSMFHLGSMEWFPNYEGLSWYLREVFPEVVRIIPQVKLFLYGRGTDKLNVPSSFSSNIIKVGYIKNIWDELADKQLAIVPLRIGSGIRVKIIEMLGLGKNIISTSIGKEGIEVEDGKHILIADSVNDFLQKTVTFFKNGYDVENISKNARRLIEEKYTWEIVAEQFENEYKNLLTNQI